jgi:hypothetical protein
MLLTVSTQCKLAQHVRSINARVAVPQALDLAQLYAMVLAAVHDLLRPLLPGVHCNIFHCDTYLKFIRRAWYSYCC